MQLALSYAYTVLAKTFIGSIYKQMKEKVLIWKLLGTPNKFTNINRNSYQRLFLKFTQKKKNVYSLRILKMLSIQYWVHIHTCQVLRLQDLNVLKLQCVMFANNDQNILSRFRLLKVWLCIKLESSNCRKLLFNFCKA